MSTPKPNNTIIRILIVDDHPVVCSGLTSMLSDASIGIEVIGSAASGEEALADRSGAIVPTSCYWICACPEWMASAC
jgi:DNA-binding NtrC family response regulator